MDRSSKPQQGFSLVELMIAMALGLAMVAAVGTLSLNATRSYRFTNQANQQMENGRYALTLLKDDLEHAGFYGGLSPMKLTLPATDPADPCDLKPQTHADSLIIPFRAYTASPGSCNLSNIQLGTTLLVIRRADTGTTAVGSLTYGKTYIQTTPDRYIIGCQACSETYPPASNGPMSGFSLRRPDNDNLLADIRRYHVHLYYIRTWSTASGDSIPTLVRVSLTNSGSDPAMTTAALVEGIENMQIQYGLDAAVGTVCHYTALPADCNGTPGYSGGTEAYVSSITSEGTGWRDWANVVAVRINLLARALEPDRNYTDNKTYDLGTGTPINPPGNALNYTRHVYSQIVRLTHPSGWRDREQ